LTRRRPTLSYNNNWTARMLAGVEKIRRREVAAGLRTRDWPLVARLDKAREYLRTVRARRPPAKEHRDA
jgi:hypothetical protein